MKFAKLKRYSIKIKRYIRKTVYFNEYVDKLNSVFNLENKLVCSKLMQFRKEKRRVDGKEDFLMVLKVFLMLLQSTMLIKLKLKI